MTKLEANEILACYYIGKGRMPTLATYEKLGHGSLIWHWDCVLAGGIDMRQFRHIPYSQIVALCRCEAALG